MKSRLLVGNRTEKRINVFRNTLKLAKCGRSFTPARKDPVPGTPFR